MSLATRIGEEFNLVRDEGMARLNALAPYNGIIGTDAKQQQENLVFSTTVGNEYKLADTSRFRKIDGKVIDTLGTQTIDFSRNGQHPFEVYTNTALTAPNNVLAGDYVVVDTPELVIDKTVPAAISRATFDGTTLTVDSGQNTGYVYYNIPTVVGVKYIFKVNIIAGSNVNTLMQIRNIGVISLVEMQASQTGEYYINHVATETTCKLFIFSIGTLTTINIDNISVKLADDTYRATRDSSEMYDVDLPVSGVVVVTTGLIYKYNGGGVAGTVGNFYKRIGSSSTTNNISIYDFNMTNVWTDLGPASTMSLQNPYFQTRNYISNQVLAMQKADGTIHTETLFVDAYAVETTNEVLVKNGWSKLENGLYSKGTVVGTPVGYWQTLNKGAYHPVYNSFGCDRFINNTYDNTGIWYTSVAQTQDLTSTYNMFFKWDGMTSGISRGLGSIVSTITGNGRPDTKYYNIVYTDQFRDLRTNAEKANIPQLLNEVHNGAVNGSLGGYSDCVGIVQLKGETYTSHKFYYYTNGEMRIYQDDISKYLEEDYKVGDYISFYATSPLYYSYVRVAKVVSLSTNSILIKPIEFITTDIVNSYNDNHNVMIVKQLPITSYKTSLTTDIIGNPSSVNSQTYTTTGATQTLTIAIDQVVYYKVASGTTGTGTVGNYYKALTVQTDVDLDTELFDTDTTNWLDLGTTSSIKVGGYPSMMTDRLASGKPLVGMNPLLVSDTGDNLIPDGGAKNKKLSSKATNVLQALYEPDGLGWDLRADFIDSTGSVVFSSISNSINDSNNNITNLVGSLTMVCYTSSNTVANISTPKAVQQVENYTVATNSHSIYKGNNLTQLIGKVGVGNGAKGLESKVVENITNESYWGETEYDLTTDYSGLKTILGKKFLVTTGNPSMYGDGFILKYIGKYANAVSTKNVDYENPISFSIVGYVGTTPTHSTIDLDNSNSPAIKTLSTIATADDGELLYQVFGEEIVGTGDTGSFSKLTNGTKTDWNGTTVKTVCATIGTGVYK